MTKPLDNSWQRYPEARVRMREDSIKTILEGLGENGFCIDAGTRVDLVDEGIYVNILLNVGEHGNIVALPIDVLIPTEIPEDVPKKTRKPRVAKTAPVVDIPLSVEEETSASEEEVQLVNEDL